jgi:hypothetical protein
MLDLRSASTWHGWCRVPLRYFGCITWTRRGRQHDNTATAANRYCCLLRLSSTHMITGQGLDVITPLVDRVIDKRSSAGPHPNIDLKPWPTCYPQQQQPQKRRRAACAPVGDAQEREDMTSTNRLSSSSHHVVDVLQAMYSALPPH